MSIAWLQMLGPWEIGIAIFLILLLFGGKKLPQLARGLGESFKELRKGARELHKDDDE
jgi:sec-independent protein translocase protein TatA